MHTNNIETPVVSIKMPRYLHAMKTPREARAAKKAAHRHARRVRKSLINTYVEDYEDPALRIVTDWTFC